ncbi:MAG: hypothetical protein ACFFHD_07305 [Promethearchaeota archaeon]
MKDRGEIKDISSSSLFKTNYSINKNTLESLPIKLKIGLRE